MTPPRQDGLGESSGSDSVDPIAAVEAALGAFRGRGPGGPFGSGPFGAGQGPFARGPGGWGDHSHGDHSHGHGDHSHGGRRGGPGGHAGRGGHAAMRLLIMLSNHGPSSVSDLATTIGVDQPRASRLVQAAVEAGHVRREVDPADARRSILVITEAGRAALSAVIDHRRTAIEQALADFSPDERAEFARLLTRFAEAWRRG
ncbi:MarR family winged helix-turn-helix transcriptional regulator [Agromyces humatus]|uniref:HTH marR-type domain-containing protein n=1 Tax=Agromyces humatus TaxID=279573 RepID=A0ABN2KR67_9MICO|nr:MarR family winged helix-turn-helix transcriptional regulator [Agromyces humatus]